MQIIEAVDFNAAGSATNTWAHTSDSVIAFTPKDASGDIDATHYGMLLQALILLSNRGSTSPTVGSPGTARAVRSGRRALSSETTRPTFERRSERSAAGQTLATPFACTIVATETEGASASEASARSTPFRCGLPI